MSCSFAHDDAAYVLGALSPAERRAFEEHLADCDSCSRAVTELSGIPGLLTRTDPAVLDDAPATEPTAPQVPDTLLPRLQRRARSVQRRRTTAAAALAAAAAAAVVTGGFVVSGALTGGGATAGGPPTVHVPTALGPGREMTPVQAAPIQASVALRPVPWGTRLEMLCSYDAPRGAYPSTATSDQPATYALVVHTRDGRTQQVATWHSLPGRTMHLTAATAAMRSQITSVEVRTGDGRSVLRLRA